MNLGVIGTGHVGLVTCVSIAAESHGVVGTDQDEDPLTQLLALQRRKGLRVPLPTNEDPYRVDAGCAISNVPKPIGLRSARDLLIRFPVPAGALPKIWGEANPLAVEQAVATPPIPLIEKSTVPKA